MLFTWLSDNWIEIFGAVAGIVYVFLEIRQNILLWPVGIITSAIYIIVFFSSRFYADMTLQAYYLVISCAGWFWWMKGRGHRAEGEGQSEKLLVTRIKMRMGMVLTVVFVLLYLLIWLVLSRLTDSPVPAWDSFITSLSVVATWMLARKIYEHWYLWVLVNTASSLVFFMRELYPTMVLYIVYLLMSFVGLRAWRKSLATRI